MALLCRVSFCIVFFGLCLYFFIDKQNQLTELSLLLPEKKRELRALEEENMRLEYAIDSYESPIHLMELARKPEFAHLKHPYFKDIIIVEMCDPQNVAVE